MEGWSILLAAAAIAVDFGWQPSPQHQGDLDYVIQLEPAVLAQLERGEIVINDIPPDVRGGRRFVLRVGAGDVPRQGTPRKQQLIPFGTTGLRTGAGSVPAVVVQQGEPIPWNAPVQPGAQPATAAQPGSLPGAAPALLDPRLGAPQPGPTVNPTAFPAPVAAAPQPGVTVTTVPATSGSNPPRPATSSFPNRPPPFQPTAPQTPTGQPAAAPAWNDPLVGVPAPTQPAPAAQPQGLDWPDPNVGVASVPRGPDLGLNPQPVQPAPPVVHDDWMQETARGLVPQTLPGQPPRTDLALPQQDFLPPRTDLVAPRTDWPRREWNDPSRPPAAGPSSPMVARVDPRGPAAGNWDWPPATMPSDRNAAYPPIPYAGYDPRVATPTSYLDTTPRIGLSKVAETVKDAQLTSATALAATRATPVAPPKPEIEKQQPWTPLLLTVLGLFLSIGGNLYLWWIWWDSQRRYLGLIRELRTARV